MGVNFTCPSCGKTRLGVKFANPVDGREPFPPQPEPPNATPEQKETTRQYNLRWQRSGETFETLSISPSIDASGIGHWHGFITNGEISGTGPCALPS
jgi:hypothetical protein